MAKRKVNFNPGPATLPEPVLAKLAESTVELDESGMSVLEISHRSKTFAAILERAQRLVHELFSVPDTHQVLFLGGGASLQFCMVPMNLLRGGTADYVVTGAWAKKAAAEAERFGTVHLAGDGSQYDFAKLPEELDFTPGAAYVHITTNNTIYGTQWRDFPDVGEVPLVADMSSDIMSHRWDVSRFALIYAGAQKNLGPAGVTVVIVRKDLVERCADDVPTMLAYRTHVEKNSLFNTPPVGAIYAVMLVLEWMAEQGGLDEIERRNEQKAQMVYQMLDEKPDFYRGTVREPRHRSYMNATFRLPTEELEERFVAAAAEEGLHGLKGHRSVGGVRVSMYNAMPVSGVERLVDFMKRFAANN